ncbi:hypothetical protein HDU81_000430, partial [Chytriomyces hyalinus]
LTLDGVLIEQVNSAEYLSVSMSPKGVEMTKQLEKHCSYAKKTAKWLWCKGMNAYGFQYLQSLHLYPVFIRSQLEYAMCPNLTVHMYCMLQAQMLHPPDSLSLYVVSMRQNKFWSCNTTLLAKHWRNLTVEHPLAPTDSPVPFSWAAKQVISLPDKAIDEYHFLSLTLKLHTSKSHIAQILTVTKM